jgi:hypothetical protein
VVQLWAYGILGELLRFAFAKGLDAGVRAHKAALQNGVRDFRLTREIRSDGVDVQMRL